jgi:hypothetical protein
MATLEAAAVHFSFADPSQQRVIEGAIFILMSLVEAQQADSAVERSSTSMACLLVMPQMQRPSPI